MNKVKNRTEKQHRELLKLEQDLSVPDNAVNITEIQQQLTAHLGCDKPSVPGIHSELMDSILRSNQFNEYMENRTYQWIVRTYLVNARLQGHLGDACFESYMAQAETDAGCEQLAVSILLSALEKADSLPSFKPMYL